MTIPSTPRKAGPLLGTGAQTDWPFTFKVFAESDIAVTIADNLGTETLLVLDTDYSVALNANQDTSPGGTVTHPIAGDPLAVGSVLSITGALEYDQPLDLPGGGKFSPTALENELDRLTMQIQQLREENTRALRLNVTTDADPELPAPSANAVIAWDGAGAALQNIPLTDLATGVAFADYRYNIFTGTGAQTIFTLTSSPVLLSNISVSVDGLVFMPGVDYSITGVSLTFVVAPANGAEILARYGHAVEQSSPAGTDYGLLSSSPTSFADYGTVL